ncbi:MAG: hypothetical protein A4E32_00803 [Methanomassiliicoccales archaeon PtaU1.Bin124]|nr:MAG: hypothetical protein A4E32_00803 [Methanomassiliicoccales archaeon PtaU1.Bin124]
METDTIRDIGPRMVDGHNVGDVTRDQKSIVRIGGVAGLLAGFSFILAAIALLGGSVSNGPNELVQNFPQVSTSMAIGDGLYLITVLSLFILVIALYHELRRQNSFLAMVGGGIGSIGLSALAIGSMPHVAYSKISEIFHSPTTTSEEQTSLVHMWQAVHGIFNEMDTVGFMLLALGFIILSLAMRRSPSFGRRVGCAGVILGATVLFGMSIFTMDSSAIFPFVLIAFVIMPVLFGSNLFRISRRKLPGVDG